LPALTDTEDAVSLSSRLTFSPLTTTASSALDSPPEPGEPCAKAPAGAIRVESAMAPARDGSLRWKHSFTASSFDENDSYFSKVDIMH
jgi:hypothetical protein